VEKKVNKNTVSNAINIKPPQPLLIVIVNVCYGKFKIVGKTLVSALYQLMTS